MSELKPEHWEIIRHTLFGAARQRYCGDSKEVKDLVKAGYMRSLGKVSWVPSEYFTVTDAGVKAWNQRAGCGDGATKQG